MALALRMSASSFAFKWQPLGFGFAFPRHSGPVSLRLVNLRWTRGRSLRCSNSIDAEEAAAKANSVGAQSNGVDPEETVEKVVAQNNVTGSNSATVLHSSSWDDEEPSTDGYSGWTPFDMDRKSNKLAGLLKIVAGIALVVAFSFVGYKAFSRKGSLKEVLFSTSTHLLQHGDDHSGSDANESLDAHKSLDSKSSTTPSSNESKQDAKGENPQSGRHQKEAASGQDSLSDKDVRDFSDEENIYATESRSDSDVDFREDALDPEEVDNNAASGQDSVSSDSEEVDDNAALGQDFVSSKDATELSDEESVVSPESQTDSDLEVQFSSDSEEVDNKSASSAEDQVQPRKGRPNPKLDVSENDALPADDRFILVSNATSNPASAWVESSPDKFHFLKSSLASTPRISMLELGKEQSDDSFLGDAGNTDSIKEIDLHKSVVGKLEASPSADSIGRTEIINGLDQPKAEASPSAESNEETMFTVSASMVVNKATAEEMLELLELDSTPFKVDAEDLTAPEPHLNESPSVTENMSSSLGSELWHSESVESFAIPAPSAPSAAAQATSRSVAVSATVDEEQEQALTALQALKVIEPGVESGGICTRREYARWLIAITGALARSPAQKVFPAMYIDTVSELAFNDVVPEDPDFPYIQGLAEAGLISSNLSRHDANKNGRSTDGAIFLPDSPLSRQDLISWKVALEGHNVETADVKKVKAESVYIDMDRIDEEALPFLAIDLAAGERSTIATVFGYTKRLQPGKPVTRAQAAMALITGDAADVVAEELTRLEADGIADAAVVAELALESRAQKQVDEYFNTELKSLEKRFEEVQNELERVMKEKDTVQAVVKVERDMLHKFRVEVEEQLRTLTAEKIEVGIEKDRLEVLRKKAEYGGQDLASVKVEVEVEKKALILARLWAEDEAKKARVHAKVLEEARKRWEGQGIEVRVDKDLQDDNIPALGWKYGGRKTNLNKFLQRPPVQDILEKAGDLKNRTVRRLLELLEALQRAIARLWHSAAESLHGAGGKASESLRVAGEKASDSLCVVRDKTSLSLRVAGDKARSFQQDTFLFASKKAQEAQDATRSTVVGLSSSVTEGTRKIADGFRGEAQKLAGKFKSS